VLLVVLALGSGVAGGCRSGFGPAGSECSADDQCDDALRCIAEVCRPPDADSDNDGLDNRTEALLGTDPGRFDTDGDLIGDGEEGDVDTDGDGIIDALESAVADADRDCLPDQFDDQNTTPLSDPTQARQLLCSDQGLCADHGEAITLTCRHVEVEDQVVVEVTCDYSAVPGYEGTDELSCDGLDNDCDGGVDEGLAYAGPDGTAVPLGSACTGVGACATAEGLAECAADGRVVCSVNRGGSDFAGAAEGVCNAVDDDCNGIVDDGLGWEDPTDGTMLPLGATCDGRGVCGVGTVECGADGTPVCSTEPSASGDQSGDEKCDGLDNDCDGLTDEDQELVQRDGKVLQLGDACGLGPCAGGTVECAGGVAVCSTDALADPGEWCNGIDDDCDGTIDEAASLAVYCPDADAGVCDGAIPLAAVCDGEGETPRCAYAPTVGWEAEETTCDGLDNDCDGLTDEDLGWVSPEGLWAPLGSPCEGIGACGAEDNQAGTVVCHEGQGQCSANLAAIDVLELCNGVDDDCDGETDEVDPTIPGGGVCKAKGVCAAYVDTLPTCANGEWACGYGADPAFELTESLCDGLDNDCDGLTDENTAKVFEGEPTIVLDGQPPTRLWQPVEGIGWMWQAGGLNRDQEPMADVWRYSPQLDAWERKADLPTPVGAAATAWVDAYQVLLVHGGVTTPLEGAKDSGFGGGTAPTDTLRLYDAATGAWATVAQQVASEVPDAAVALERAFHALCAFPDGRLVLLGGRGADGNAVDPVALEGTLESTGDNSWVVSWEAFDTQPSARLGHALLCEPQQNAVVAVGGTAPTLAAVPFVEAWLPEGTDGGSWTTLADTPSAASRLFPAVGLDADTGVLALQGGFAVPAGEAVFVSEALAGAWSMDLTTALTGTTTLWTPLELLTTLPAQGGGALNASVDDAEGWLRLGGTTGLGWTWRRSWRVSPLSVVPEEARWLLPEARYGATLVSHPKTGITYLLGGARGDDAVALPLQDALQSDPTVSVWTPIAQPVGPTSDTVASNKPTMVAASGVWDPVGKRVLLVGGLLPATGAPASKLWAYTPDADLSSGAFSKVDAQGDKPAAAYRPVFSVDPDGATAWLFGAHPSGPMSDIWTDEPFGPEVWSLALANSTWSRIEPLDGPSGLRSAGGTYGDGLDTLVMDTSGHVALWHFDGNSLTWSKLSDDLPLPDSTTLDAFVYDPLARIALVMVVSETEPESGGLWEADFEAASWTARAGSPPVGSGAAMALHPSVGAVGVGGLTAAGATSIMWRLGQSCAATNAAP